MKRTFHLGRIAYTGRKKVNPVDVTVELERKGGEEIFTIDRKTGEKTFTGQTPTYYELSICGNIWGGNHRRILAGSLDTIAQYREELDDPAFFNELYALWKKYHENGMRAGTPEQEAAVAEWKAAGNRYTYISACEMLRARGLYQVNYTGLSVARRYENEPYRYGQAWLVQELPDEVLSRVRYLLNKGDFPHKDEDFAPASDADFLSLFPAAKEESHG